MIMALPICLLMFVALAVVLLLLNKPEIRRIEGVASTSPSERAEMGGLSRAEKNTLIAFGGDGDAVDPARACVALVAGNDSDRLRQPSATGSTRASSPCSAPRCCSCCRPTGSSGEFTLDWSDAAAIDWGTIVLFGTGIIFGSLLEPTPASPRRSATAPRTPWG